MTGKNGDWLRRSDYAPACQHGLRRRCLSPFLRPLLLLLTAAAAPLFAAEQKNGDQQPPEQKNWCIACHGEKDIWEGENLRYFVSEQDLAGDIHWQKGLRCQDCHGGHPEAEEKTPSHEDRRLIQSPADIPEFCGNCHADIEYMRRYRPSPRVDQLREYWTSGHGRALKTGDTKVATCVSCHDKPHGSGRETAKHAVRRVDDLESSVYRTRLAETCAHCHADEKLMAGYQYHDRPLGHDQYEKWQKSVHAEALLKKGDLSAPTCNNCHGNHGAVPPQVDSVANACGSCHGKVASLFAGTVMKHRFEEEKLPGCATCHHSHDIRTPTDQMLGMEGSAVCAECHARGRHGATLAGAEDATTIRSGLDQLKKKIDEAKATLEEAERLGMEVSGPRFDLREADDALISARSLIHSFKVEPVEAALAKGRQVAADVQKKADEALAQHTYRRVWLAGSLVPILAVIVVLVLYIRTLPPPKESGAGSKE